MCVCVCVCVCVCERERETFISSIFGNYRLNINSVGFRGGNKIERNHKIFEVVIKLSVKQLRFRFSKTMLAGNGGGNAASVDLLFIRMTKRGLFFSSSPSVHNASAGLGFDAFVEAFHYLAEQLVIFFAS